MNSKKIFDIIGTLILAAGMLIAFSTHAFHSRIGLGDETSHLKHIIIGMALAVTGLGILIYNNNAMDRKIIKFIIRK